MTGRSSDIKSIKSQLFDSWKDKIKYQRKLRIMKNSWKILSKNFYYYYFLAIKHSSEYSTRFFSFLFSLFLQKENS